MILLCEDGSLRIYMANVDNTDYWLSPYLQPQVPIASLKPVKKKKSAKSGEFLVFVVLTIAWLGLLSSSDRSVRHP